jgi:hypothetical protein
MNWELRDGVSWSPTEYGGVLLDSTTGEYWQLNPAGAVVLAAALDGADLDRTAAALADRFEGAGDPDALAEDAVTILDELAGARLVTRR